MNSNTFRVSLSVDEADRLIYSAVVQGSITGERIDYYEIYGPNGTRCQVSVYEKHYYRAGNRLTLTVTIDNLSGYTRVHYASGGGGEGLFRFDWGASSSFANIVPNALASYIV